MESRIYTRSLSLASPCAVKCEKMPMLKYLGRDILREELERAIREAGGLRQFGEVAGVSKQMVQQTLAGKNRPGPRILKALGVVELVTLTYQYVKGWPE